MGRARAETRDLLFPTGPQAQRTSGRLRLSFTLAAPQIKGGWNTVLVHHNAKAGDGNAVTTVSLEPGVKIRGDDSAGRAPGGCFSNRGFFPPPQCPFPCKRASSGRGVPAQGNPRAWVAGTPAGGG